MQLYDINPFIRFAAQTSYISQDNPVKVVDCRVFYVISGNAELYIDEHHYSLIPGSLFYCCGGSRYNIISPNGFYPLCINFDLTQEYRNHTLHFTPCNNSSEWDNLTIFHQNIEDSDFLNSHYFTMDGSSLYHYIEKIVSEFTKSHRFYREIGGTILKELLLEMHRIEQTTLPPKIATVIKYIEKNYHKDLGNKELATLVGYHEYHLNRLFLTYTGTNLHNYLLKIRLNRARYLILNTNVPLKNIPEQVGFNSYSHFSNYFKQVYGVSPSQYRNNLKDNI